MMHTGRESCYDWDQETTEHAPAHNYS